MDNNGNSNRIDNRLLDLYQNLINQTLESCENMTLMYRETLNALMQIENGLRTISNRNINEEERNPNNLNNNNNNNNNNNRFSRNNNEHNTSPIRNQQRFNTRFNVRNNNNNRQRNNNFRVNRNYQNGNEDIWRGHTNRENSLNNETRQNNSNTQTTSTLDDFFRTFGDGNIATFQREFIFPLIPNDLQSVVVRPSQEEINIATESIRFDPNIMETSICPITRDTFIENEEILKIKHCGHYFNKLALNNWFDRSVLCPVCRYDIREYTETNNNSQHSNQSSHSNEYPSTGANSRHSSSNRQTTFNHPTVNNRETNDTISIPNMNDRPYSFNNLSFPSPSNRNISSILDDFSDTVTNQFLNDLSLNPTTSNALNVRYRIETPNNSLTLSTLSPGGFSNIFRNLSRHDNNDSNDISNNIL